MPSDPTERDAVLSASELQRLATALLRAAGLAAERAGVVAEVLLEGDLLGHPTHGLALLPAYLSALDKRTMERAGEPETVSDHGSAFTWDGRYLPGPWLVRQAISQLKARMNEHPIVTAVIRRSHHIGCLQAYLKPVTDDGLLIFLCCSDPASFVVAPHGGTEARFSPNPIGIGIPTGDTPVLIDMSTSATALGQCLAAASAGRLLPGEWLLEKDGRPTRDPQVMTASGGGCIQPLGGMDLGYKGFALALWVEALTNALGAHGRADDERRWSGSVFLQIIDPTRFGGLAAFERETSFLATSCKSSRTQPGVASVRLPGERALRLREQQLRDGVRLSPSTRSELSQWAQRYGVEG